MDFRDVYTKRNISSEALLYDPHGCVKATECWAKCEKKKGPYNKIYQPFVGENYGKTRLVVVAENLYNGGIDGGLDRVEKLAKDAKDELNTGVKKVCFSKSEDSYCTSSPNDNSPPKKSDSEKKYAGTYFWYFVGAYGILLADKLGLKNAQLVGKMPTTESAARGFDYLSYTNHVKCCPYEENGRGRPSKEMWKNCGKTILKDELTPLDPRWVLILGKSNNFWSFRNHILEGHVDAKSGCVRYGIAEINGKPVRIVVAPHPSWYRKSQSAILEDVSNAFDELNRNGDTLNP